LHPDRIEIRSGSFTSVHRVLLVCFINADA